MEKRWFYNCLMEHGDFRGGKSYHKTAISLSFIFLSTPFIKVREKPENIQNSISPDCGRMEKRTNGIFPHPFYNHKQSVSLGGDNEYE